MRFLSFVGHRGLRFQRAQPLLPRRRYSDACIGDQASDACESPSKGQKRKNLQSNACQTLGVTMFCLGDLALEELQKPRWARSLRRFGRRAIGARARCDPSLERIDTVSERGKATRQKKVLYLTKVLYYAKVAL